MPDLPSNRLAYSDRNALFCAQLSNLAYLEFETREEREALNEALGKVGAKLIPDGDDDAPRGSVVSRSKGRGKKKIDTQAIYVEHEDTAIRAIVFRGTETQNVTDWVTDARIELKPVEDGVELHDGFLSAYDLVDDEVVGWIEDAGEKPLFVCGHSLGGALAVVASVKNRATPFGSCYTFGGPRVGVIHDEKVKTPIYRVTNQSDPVPEVPPASLFSRYRHIGDEYQLSDGALVPTKIGGDRLADQIAELLSDGLSFFQQSFGSGFASAVGDLVKTSAGAHESALYVHRLTTIADARNP